ncbi:putative nectin-4-like [Sesbania bispinosa]|nr:putative nectin-4-like [Sesbania bispinosa]
MPLNLDVPRGCKQVAHNGVDSSCRFLLLHHHQEQLELSTTSDSSLLVDSTSLSNVTTEACKIAFFPFSSFYFFMRLTTQPASLFLLVRPFSFYPGQPLQNSTNRVTVALGRPSP